MKRLIIVSNRLPMSVEIKGKSLQFKSSPGGLATGLGSIYKSKNYLWIGWPGIAKEKIKGREEEIKTKLLSENCYPVFLSQSEIENYYYGFSNKTLWPLFHYFPQYAIYDENLWIAYKKINEIFCDMIIKLAKPEDIIWIHDYQLMLLSKLIREKFPTSTIGFFLHIPFPSFEIFRLLPWRKEILEALTKADLIGFHTYSYGKHFLDSVGHLLGYEYSFNQITTGNRVLMVGCFPMGIDSEKFKNAIQNPKVQRKSQKMKKKIGERKIILSIDRLDYTKGIPQRLKVFEKFLAKNPEYKGKVTLILAVVPSRQKVEHYQLLKKELEELVGEINGKYGTFDWTPVCYFYRSFPFKDLCALYYISDVALLTPLRDGMNLIAKEFLATKIGGKGVLILSEMTGASAELGEALIVNPQDKEEIASALKKALTMSEEEQKIRNIRIQARIQRYDINRWEEDFLKSLTQIKAIQREFEVKLLNPKMERKIIRDYRQSQRHLFLLDCDGTLLPFSIIPERTKPDNGLLKLLDDLSQEPQNEVVILSSRDKDTLEEWFGKLEVGLVAEHGAWLKEKNGNWKISQPLTGNWKGKIRPIMQLYVDRTPGSFIEEKEFSLAWHYRKVMPELAFIRGKELKDELLNLILNLNLEVLEGNKVIEIKNAGINKGNATLKWLKKKKWDFILAIGDDKTDEDIFKVLPPFAYSIKVGLGASQAKFNLTSWLEVRSLLKGIEYGFRF